MYNAIYKYLNLRFQCLHYEKIFLRLLRPNNIGTGIMWATPVDGVEN